MTKADMFLAMCSRSQARKAAEFIPSDEWQDAQARLLEMIAEQLQSPGPDSWSFFARHPDSITLPTLDIEGGLEVGGKMYFVVRS